MFYRLEFVHQLKDVFLLYWMLYDNNYRILIEA
jgi:hypothetical protein